MKKFLTLIFILSLVFVYGQDSPGKYTIKNASINTQSSDFGTAFFGNDKVVFASPKQGFTLNREEATNQPFLDLYIGEVTEEGQIIRKQKLQGDINSKYHEGMVSFTKDMKTVYFSANNYVKKKKNKTKVKSTSNIQLFRASISEDGEWTNLVLLPFNGDKFSSGHPVLNRDDSQLYFVSDRPESIGKTDLFVVDIHEDGTYSDPRNLGPQINTKDREMFPFIGKDNVLYFSSDGYPGFGELDVYASKIFDSTVSEPINLEEPVNSEFDDFAYIIDDHKHRGYFSSNRGGGHGDDDIYSFIASPPIYIECQQEITGVARDVETQELVPDVMIVLYDAQGSKLQTFISSKEKAAFDFQQPCNTTYTIKGYLKGHLVGELDIETVNDLNAEPIEITLNLNLNDIEQEAIIAEIDSQTQQNLQSQAMGTEEVVDNALVDSFNDSDGVYVKNEEIIAADQVQSSATLTKGVTSENGMSQTSNPEVNAVAGAAIIAHQAGQKETDSSINGSPEAVAQHDTKEPVSESSNSSVQSVSSEAGSVNTVAIADNQIDTEVDKVDGELNTVEQSLDLKNQTDSSVYAVKASEVETNREVAVNNNIEAQSSHTSKVEQELDTSIAGTTLQEESAVSQTGLSAIDENKQALEKESIASGKEENTKGVQSSNYEKDSQGSEAIVAITASREESDINETKTSAIDQDEQTLEKESIALTKTEKNQKVKNTSPEADQYAKIEIAMNNGSENKDEPRSKKTPLQSGSSEIDLIHINTIYFDYNKYDIRLDAKIELEKIAVVLKEHPESKLKVNAHTDIRGKEAYNMTLSKNRAKHTIQYLLDQGIELGRISGEGHGESQVVEKCTKQNPCTGLQHQLNRRSEFLIVDNISDIIIAKSINKASLGNYAISERAPNSGVYLNYDFSNDREVYTVQIGAFKGKLQNNKYKKLTNLFNYKYDDGLNRYYAGIFASSIEARSYLKEMKKQGFEDAFVVGLKGTNRF